MMEPIFPEFLIVVWLVKGDQSFEGLIFLLNTYRLFLRFLTGLAGFSIIDCFLSILQI